MAKVAHDAEILERLFLVIESRKGGDPGASYTAKLLAEGKQKIAKKLGEEATETVIAATAGTPAEVARESADLLYHLLVMWAATGVTPGDVAGELTRRESVFGITEKKRRKL